MTLAFEELRVAEVIRETSDSCSIVLDLPESMRESFSYRSGQFLAVEIPWQDFSIRRCYSLSSAPGIDAAPQVTVKRVPEGRASNWINDYLKRGSRIRVSPPMGRFILNETARETDLTLFGAGSGITPLISLLKTALARTDRSVLLIYANRDAQSVIFGEQLAALEEKHSDRLQVIHHLDDVAGFPTREALRAAFRGREAGEFYVCGPEVFMELVETTLESAGVAVGQTFFERFVSLTDPDRLEDGPDVALDDAADIALDVASNVGQGDLIPESFVVKLAGRKHTVPYNRGETLLAAAKRAGIKAPSSCEDGFCGSCMAQHVKGDLRMRSHKALRDHEVRCGRVLLCQSIPTSGEPLLVDYDEASFRIDGSSDDRRLPRLVGVATLLFIVLGVWILRAVG